MEGHTRNALTPLVAALLALPLILFFISWTGKLPSAFKNRLAKKAASAPLARRAREFGITYESFINSPMDSLGKPVLWCVHLSSSQAYCGPGRDNPVDITNAGEMPPELYHRSSSDSGCRRTLLEITGVKTFELDGAGSVRPQARFIDWQ